MRIAATLLIAGLVITPGAPALAQSSPPERSTLPAKSATHKATGVVKSVDRAKGSVVLAHDPVPTLKWPAMTMPFLVKDKPLLDRLQSGKQVEFDFVQAGRDYVITSVK
jgi:Cu(I)/Ag(I) efflux system protein CusF